MPVKAKTLEVFRSIQGEGKYAGYSQIFVRFFECNMHCIWCDTPHSIGDTSRRFDEEDVTELFAKIKELWDGCHSVSLTGGEPLIQVDFIKQLIPYLKQERMPVYLETNGIFYKELSEIIDDIDIVAMDIKLPSSTQCQPYWREHEAFLRIAKKKDVFIKTVITCETKQDDIEHAVDLVASIDPKLEFIIQPNSFDLPEGVMNKCMDFQKLCLCKLSNVRVIPQMHRIMKVR